MRRSADQVTGALHSEQAEGISDRLLDGVAVVANRVIGGTFEEQFNGARNAADKAVGTAMQGSGRTGVAERGSRFRYR